MTPLQLALATLLAACGGAAADSPSPAPSSAPFADDGSVLVGTWSTSPLSYEDAVTATSAVRLTARGDLEKGAWEDGRFVLGAPAPADPRAASRYQVHPKTHTIGLGVGAIEQQATYAIDGPDRWRLIARPPQVATVYHARRAGP